MYLFFALECMILYFSKFGSLNLVKRDLSVAGYCNNVKWWLHSTEIAPNVDKKGSFKANKKLTKLSLQNMIRSYR